jgi:hypothetical protein
VPDHFTAKHHPSCSTHCWDNERPRLNLSIDSETLVLSERSMFSFPKTNRADAVSVRPPQATPTQQQNVQSLVAYVQQSQATTEILIRNSMLSGILIASGISFLAENFSHAVTGNMGIGIRDQSILLSAITSDCFVNPCSQVPTRFHRFSKHSASTQGPPSSPCVRWCSYWSSWSPWWH